MQVLHGRCARSCLIVCDVVEVFTYARVGHQQVSFRREVFACVHSVIRETGNRMACGLGQPELTGRAGGALQGTSWTGRSATPTRWAPSLVRSASRRRSCCFNLSVPSLPWGYSGAGLAQQQQQYRTSQWRASMLID